MTDHENRHGTERHAQPAHKTKKIGAIKFVWLCKSQHHCDHSEDNADHQRALGNLSDHRRRRQINEWSDGAHGWSSGFELAAGAARGRVAPEPSTPLNLGGCEGTACPAGTSAIVAF